MKTETLRWTGWQRRNLYCGKTVVADILGNAPGPFYFCKYGAKAGWSCHSSVRAAKAAAERWARRVALPALRQSKFARAEPYQRPLYVVPRNGVCITDDDIPF